MTDETPPPPDYRCPFGHVIPERRFSRKKGCVVVSCEARKRPKKARDRLAIEEEEERLALERKALRGVGSIPAAELVPTEEVPLLAAWPAELGVDESGALVAIDLEMEKGPRDPEAVSADHLRMIVTRIEALIAQRQEINEIIADVRAFAKAIGFETPAITAVIRMRAQDNEARQLFEGVLETYRHVLGIEGPSFVIPLPAPSIEPPPLPRRISRREKQYRETMALIDASVAAEASLGLDGRRLA